MLDIQLLGAMQVLDGADVVQLPRSRKTRALLGFLAATARPQRRERLCELFWDVPDDPRASLRWSLSRLRCALRDSKAEVITADRQVVGLDLEPNQIDLLAIREALKPGIDVVSTDVLREVNGRFRGPFLAGLDFPQNPEMQSWVAGMREEGLRLQTAVLTALDDRLAATPDQAVPYLRELVQLDSTVEESWARLVERLMAAGRQQEAESQHGAALAALAEFGGATHILERARRPRKSVAAPLPIKSLSASPAHEPATDSGFDSADLSQEIRFCRAAGGARIAYATAGEGPPLIKTANWLNHLEYDWESPIWGHFLRGLAREHTLVRYDARGNGLSDWEVDELSLDAWVSDLEAVVDEAGYDRFPLLGVSQGCAISIAYAVKHPERVTHLVLYAGFAAGAFARNEDPEEIERRQAMATLIRLGWGEANPAFRQLFTSMFMPDATREQADAFNELQRRTTSAECASRYYEASARLDVRSLLHEVRTPTLVMHPRGDANVAVELGRRMAAGISGARFLPLPGQNHLFLQGEPAEARFFEEMQLFLAN